MSTNRLIGLIVYIFLAAISVWATSESLILTFDIPILVGYLVGSAAALIPAMMLGLISKSLGNRQIIPLVLGIIVFLIVWGVSLTTNSHNFYLKGALADIQQNDTKNAYTALSNLEPQADLLVETTINNCKSGIQSKITNFQNEVINRGNPGLGPHADSLKRVVELSMPGSTFNYSCPNCNTSETARREYANRVGGIMQSDLNQRALLYKNSIVPANCLNENIVTPLLSKLNSMLTNLSQFAKEDIRSALISAYTEYHKSLDCINNQLATVGSLDCPSSDSIYRVLERTPTSIELEHIGNTYKHVLKNEEFASSRFIFSLLIALIVDLGAFVIFYFIVLKSD